MDEKKDNDEFNDVNNFKIQKKKLKSGNLCHTFLCKSTQVNSGPTSPPAEWDFYFNT